MAFSKEVILKKLSNWHESDLQYLIEGIANSKLQVPYAMGESRALNMFNDEFNS
jgi:hypothetical protein